MVESSGVRAVAAGLALCLSGCSLIDPYVRHRQMDAPTRDAGTDFVRLESVIDAAEKQRLAYYDAIADRAKLRNGLPLALVPLSAAALYRGATTNTDAGKRLVLQMGILGAALYGMGNYYLAAPRERIYLAGVMALTCAIHSYEPLLVGKSGYAAFARDLPAMDAATEDVALRRQQLSSLVGTIKAKPGGTTPLTTLAESSISASDAMVTRARELSATAHRLDGQINNAGADLRYMVQRIAVQVDRQVEATEQDLAAVLRLTSGLAGTATSLAHVSALNIGAVKPADADAPSVKTALTSGDEDAARAVAAMDDLAAASDRLAMLMTKVAAYNSKVSGTVRTAAKIDDCQVQEVANELTISPPGDAFDLTAGVTRVFRVRGNSGVPDAALVGAIGTLDKDGKGPVQVTKTVEGNILVVSVLQTRAVKDLPALTLEFSSNERTNSARRTISLKPDGRDAPKSEEPKAGDKGVEQPPQSPASAKAGDTTVGPRGARADSEYETKTLTIGKLKEVQRKLGVADDGILGPITRAAIRQREGGDAPKGTLTAGLVEKILKSD